MEAASTASPSLLSRARDLGIAAAFIAGYIALDWATYAYPIRPLAITLWNPPAGLALAMLLVRGLGVWPEIAVAALLADVLVRGMPVVPSSEWVGVSVLVAGYIAMAATLVRRLEFRRGLPHLQDVSTLIVVAAIGTLVMAAAYVSVYRLAGVVQTEDFQRAVIRFWIGHLIGILTATPLLLLLADRRALFDRLSSRGWVELAAQFLAMVTALWVIFGLKWANEYRLFYLLFLPLIWVVVQHGIVGAAVGIAAIQSGLMIAVELSGYQSAAVLEFQLLMLALAVAGLFHGILVTEQRTTREALDRSESRLRAIVATAPDSIVTVASDGTIVAANPAAARIFDRPTAALVGARVGEMLPDFERAVRLGGVCEVEGIRANGSRFPAELAVGTTSSGKPQLRIAIVRDVTQRKQIEGELAAHQAALTRSARLAAAGEMAAALAHELNQPLSAIRAYARASQLLAHERASASELMQKIEQEAARAGEVIQRLRNFFRSGASQLERIRVNALLEGALARMREDARRHRIALETSIADGEAELLVDRIQIETVIHTLVGNAIEAIAPTAAAERSVRVSAGRPERGWVTVSVSDSGPGISPAIIDRLFEPFATTKPTGIGLGLAISRSMIEAHGAQLKAERSAHGTRFHFSLPTAALKEGANGSA